jgi:hypothetical protein
MKSLRLLIAAALVMYAVAGSAPQPSLLSVQEPSTQMKAEVSPVTRVVSQMSSIDRLWLQYIYQNAARVVKTDGDTDQPTIQTTDGLRAVHVAILQYIWKGLADNKPGKYPALRDAIESVFTNSLGDARRQMTPELRAKAAELFDAIAWAGLGKDG